MAACLTISLSNRVFGSPTPGEVTACQAEPTAQCRGPAPCLSTPRHTPWSCSSSLVRETYTQLHITLLYKVTRSLFPLLSLSYPVPLFFKLALLSSSFHPSPSVSINSYQPSILSTFPFVNLERDVVPVALNAVC